MREFWDRVTTVQPLPETGIVLVAGLLALGLVVWTRSWRVLRQVVTVTHEGSHAFVAMLSGRSLHGVTLHRDTTGATTTKGLARGPGLVATLAAGYIGPGLLGLIGAVVLSRGYATALLWFLLLVLALLLVQIRNWFGLLVILVCGAVLVVVTRYVPGSGQTSFAYLLMWFLLLAAPYAVVDLIRARRRGQARGSDADQLGGLTVLGPATWSALFLLVTLACLVCGAALMLGRLR